MIKEITTAPDDTPSSWKKRKAILGYFLRLLFSGLIVYLLLTNTKADLVWQNLVSLELPYFAGAFLMGIIGSILAPALVSRLSLRFHNTIISLGELVKTNFVVRLYTIILPRGIATGIRWHRYRKKSSGSDALALVVLEKLVQIFVMLSAIVIFLGIDRHILPKAASYLWWIVLALHGAVFLLLAGFLFDGIGGYYRRLSALFEAKLPSGLRSKFEKIWSAVEAFQKLPNYWIFVLLFFSTLSQLFFILNAMVLIYGLSLPITVIMVAWVRAAAFLMTLIPISVAGIGIRDSVFVTLLQLYGVAPEQALTLSFGLLGIQMAIASVGLVIEVWDHFLSKVLRVSRPRPT